ncbi:ATP-binding protein [Telmatospirillum sp.]|uniref:ATP-binding protein n=1 Tax=Telmatospirillum sp. TaxID=2079197 RepID=UPI00284F143C|nr:ATP-binding protein [Telmatospirillum sp.]MDR3438649.1 ATP-binding protein [Telmatospirillum sp.]
MSETVKPCRPAASLSTRLVVGAVAWLAVMLALGGWVLSAAFRGSAETEFGHRLEDLLQAMIADTEMSADGTVRVFRPLGDPRFDRVFSGWYWEIVDPSGKMARSRSLWDSVLSVNRDAKEIQQRTADGPNGETLLVVERDVILPDAPGPVHMLIAGDLTEVSAGVHRFDLLLGGALGLMGIGMAIAVLIQVRFGLRPLRAMQADLDAVRDGLRQRLAGRYPREVAPLAKAMNGVLDHDEVLIERARTHVGNLAHSLKTPLAILQAEMHENPDRRLVLEQLKTMARLIEHHLGRASAVAGAGRALGKRVPVGDVARDIANALRRIYADKSVAIDVDVAGDATFHGQREDIEEMLGNLMENACKWARTRVRITGRVIQDGLTIVVEDDGPGLPPEEADLASRRGTRLDEMAPGWGLGLSIVADLVAVNGGSMDFARSDLGGFMVCLRLPGGWATAV